MKTYLLFFCIVAAGAAPLLASAQFYCMTGVPCGNGCTMGDGVCIEGRCFDRTGTLEWECMAPMRAPTPLRLQSHDTGLAPPQQQQPYSWMLPRFPTWQPFSFPSFPMFKPWVMPFGPISTFADCGGNGPCGRGQFCDAQGVCRADDCSNQLKYGCPDDKGELNKMSCPHFSGFKECYASSTGGFRCFKGPTGSSIACATQSGTMSGAVWTDGSGYQSSDYSDEDITDTAADAAAASSSSTSTASKPSTGTAPLPTSTTTTSTSSSTASPNTKQSAFKKVVTEAGPATKAVPTTASAEDATAAAAKKSLQDAVTPAFMMQAANDVNTIDQLPPGAYVGPLRTADGGSLMAAGPGPAISMMNVAPNGAGMAGGMAAGDQKSVTISSGPNGRMASTRSVSTNGGPAIASSVATSTPSSTDQMTPQMPDMPDAFRPPQGASASTAAATTNPPEESQALPAQQRQQQGNAATSREGVIREAPAAADTAKPTTSSPAAVKSSAGGGLRGGAWVWQLLLAGCIAVLLL